MTREQIYQELIHLSDPKYKEFSMRLTPGVPDILGVRLPLVRKLAIRETKGDWRELWNHIPPHLSMEETMLLGMTLGYAKDLNWNEFLEKTALFIPRITNWSVCDSFCCSLKRISLHRQDFWDFLQPYLFSQKEFEVRFGAVVLLNFYIEESWIDRVLCVLTSLKPNGYYAKMGIAWALSACWVSFPSLTKEILQSADMEKEIYEKTIQKVMESSRISKEEKAQLRAIKKSRDNGIFLHR